MNAHTKRDGRSAVTSFGVAFHVFLQCMLTMCCWCVEALRCVPFTDMSL